MSISSSIVVSHRFGAPRYVNNPVYLNSQRSLSWNPFLKLAVSKTTNQISLSCNKRKSFVVYACVPGVAPLPSGPPPSGSSKSWIIGILMSFILPFFTHKMGPLSLLKNRIDGAVQMVENITETVEKVAEEVDKIAENIAHDLPEGNLKHLAEFVEHVAEKTAKAADTLDDVIDKVQEAEDEVECIVESVVTKESSKKEKKKDQ